MFMELMRAAHAGDAKAQFDLGSLYVIESEASEISDELRNHNHRLAFHWFHKAATAGHTPSQAFLGCLYKTGTGVAQDPIAQLYWWNQAAAGGNLEAMCGVGDIYKTGRGPSVAQDLAEAARYYRMAAEAGHVLAQRKLGYCYRNGEGVEKDPCSAARWWRKAADAGDADAQCSLGLCYEMGAGVKVNRGEAVLLCRQAALGGSSRARKMLDAFEIELGDCVETPSASGASAPGSSRPTRSCAAEGCSAPGALMCSRCMKVGYCSAECQRADFGAHKAWCRATTARRSALYAQMLSESRLSGGGSGGTG